MQIAVNENRMETVTPSRQSGHWAWRYAFNQPGKWQIRFIAHLTSEFTAHSLTGEWQLIDVDAHQGDVMLPVSQSEDPRYWQTSDGSWFYPMGITIRSPGDSRQDRLMQQVGATDTAVTGKTRHPCLRRVVQKTQTERWKLRAHVDVALVDSLEWNRQWDGYNGLGRYNQANAARIDRILELAHHNNIYLQLELANHGMTSEHVDEQWNPDSKRGTLGSPYNSVNGGPVDHAADFYADSEAWKYHQRRLRYTVARWGWALHIMSWVLSSEMEFTGAYWQEA